MARADALSILYSKTRTPLEFNFDSLMMAPMANYVTMQDINSLYNVASSVRYASKVEAKYKVIDEIMRNRGFKKYASGTNRVVYNYLEDSSFLAKIAIDRTGLTNNPDEYKNQFYLKPFVTKIFEVSPGGVLAFTERVDPITSRQEFLSVAEDIFNMITNCIIGEYVVADIGTKYFMNWGLRKGLGPVLLDFPTVYKLDGNKLFCNKQNPITGEFCNGEIDYDEGFNDLYCTKCGKRHEAQFLKKDVDNGLLLLKGESDNMKVQLVRGNDIVLDASIAESSSVDTSKVSTENKFGAQLTRNMPKKPKVGNNKRAFGNQKNNKNHREKEERTERCKQEKQQSKEEIKSEVKTTKEIQSDLSSELKYTVPQVFNVESEFTKNTKEEKETSNEDEVLTKETIEKLQESMMNSTCSNLRYTETQLSKSSETNEEKSIEDKIATKYAEYDNRYEENERSEKIKTSRPSFISDNY